MDRGGHDAETLLHAWGLREPVRVIPEIIEDTDGAPYPDWFQSAARILVAEIGAEACQRHYDRLVTQRPEPDLDDPESAVWMLY